MQEELEQAPVETTEQWQSRKLREKRIAELAKLLESTDHKTFSDYEPKEGEILADVIADRKLWRNEIRELLDENNPA